MAKVFMSDPATGRAALYDEPTLSGDPKDPNSARNAPLNNPATYLPNIYFHSDFNYLEVIQGPTNVVIAHAAVPLAPTPPGATINFGWGAISADHLLLTHNLGYAPKVLVIAGNNTLWPGMPVQTNGTATRFISCYVTTTEVRLIEFSSQSYAALPALNQTYTVIVLSDPPAASGNILMDFDPSTGVVQMGRGKFRSDRRYLQVVPGGSPFAITYGGKTIDLQNGAMRAVRPDGVAYDPVPPTLQLGLARQGLTGVDWGFVPGASMGYGGSFVGPGNIQVQAP